MKKKPSASSSSRKTRIRYRILEDGEEIWQGNATSFDDAIEKCYWNDDGPDESCVNRIEYFRPPHDGKPGKWLKGFEF